MTLLALSSTLTTARLLSSEEGGHAGAFLGLPLSVWQVLNLVLFLAVLIYFVAKPMSAAFRKRQDEIEERRRQAEKQRADVDRLSADIRERTAKLEREIEEIRKAGRRSKGRPRGPSSPRGPTRKSARVGREAKDEIERRVAAAREELRRARAGLPARRFTQLAIQLAGGTWREKVTAAGPRAPDRRVHRADCPVAELESSRCEALRGETLCVRAVRTPPPQDMGAVAPMVRAAALAAMANLFESGLPRCATRCSLGCCTSGRPRAPARGAALAVRSGSRSRRSARTSSRTRSISAAWADFAAIRAESPEQLAPMPRPGSSRRRSPPAAPLTRRCQRRGSSRRSPSARRTVELAPGLGSTPR